MASQCPDCGATFRPGEAACPECGLELDDGDSGTGMAKYTVTFKGVTWATVTVEAADEDAAIEAAFADGFPKLCGHCAGYAQDWKLEIPDDPASWDLDADGAGVSEAREDTP